MIAVIWIDDAFGGQHNSQRLPAEWYIDKHIPLHRCPALPCHEDQFGQILGLGHRTPDDAREFRSVFLVLIRQAHGFRQP